MRSIRVSTDAITGSAARPWTRKLGERGSLGAEAFRQGGDEIGGTPSTYLGIGATRAVAPHWIVLAAAGGFTAHTQEHGRYRLYLALLFHG